MCVVVAPGMKIVAAVVAWEAATKILLAIGTAHAIAIVGSEGRAS